MGRLAIIVPLREGASHEAVGLLQQGPPVQQENGGIDRYWAFLTPSEAVLVFEGPGVGRSDDDSWQDLSAWRNGSRWERCAAAAPRLARGVHSWVRTPDIAGAFFGPLPGPGDSDGGDTVELPNTGQGP